MPSAWLLLATAFLPGPPVLAAPQSSALTAAATASGRPPECAVGSRRALAKGPSVWERARVPNLSRYCDLMARAQVQLATDATAARAAALDADAALPGHAAPLVVSARAALALGALDEAARAFDKARLIDPRSVEDPPTLHDYARVLVRMGRRADGLAAYRALVPRIDLLGTADRRVAVLLEAAHAAMSVETLESNAAGAVAKVHPRLDEAAAYLREARQRPPTLLAGDVVLSLALVLDRAGERDAADAVLAEAPAPSAKRRADALDYAASKEDETALTALAAEASDRAAAIRGWESFVAGPGGKGAWAGAARARLELLKRGGASHAARVGPGARHEGRPR